MKTKIIVLFFAIIMAFLYSCCSFAQNNLSEDQQIRDMLKGFYTSYMTQFANGADQKKLEEILSKYCTKNLLKAVDSDQELDYDPWLSGQDADVENLKTLSITNSGKLSNEYVVTYEDGFDKEKTSIKLVVVKEKDGYKIDSVQSEGGKKYGGDK